MELKDTIQMMISEDYRLRFKAEYQQLQIRIQKLERIIETYNAQEPEFIPTCPESLLRSQLKTMQKYAFILEARACIENITDLNLDIDQEIVHNVLYDMEIELLNFFSTEDSESDETVDAIYRIIQSVKERYEGAKK